MAVQETEEPEVVGSNGEWGGLDDPQPVPVGSMYIALPRSTKIVIGAGVEVERPNGFTGSNARKEQPCRAGIFKGIKE